MRCGNQMDLFSQQNIHNVIAEKLTALFVVNCNVLMGLLE